MKRIIALLICLFFAAGAIFAIDMHVDPDSGVQSNGFFSLYLQSEDGKDLLYINVTPKPTASTLTAAVIQIDGKPYVPDNLLWYRNEDCFISPIMIANEGSSFSTYAEIYDDREDGISLFMGYYEDELQCFGGPDDLIWSLLMEKQLDVSIYDEWGYLMGDLHFTVVDDTEKLLQLFSSFIKYSFEPTY